MHNHHQNGKDSNSARYHFSNKFLQSVENSSKHIFDLNYVSNVGERMNGFRNKQYVPYKYRVRPELLEEQFSRQMKVENTTNLHSQSQINKNGFSINGHGSPSYYKRNQHFGLVNGKNGFHNQNEMNPNHLLNKTYE